MCVFSGLSPAGPGRAGQGRAVRDRAGQGWFGSCAVRRNPGSSRCPETVRMMNIPKVTDESVTQPTPNETTRPISQWSQITTNGRTKD